VVRGGGAGVVVESQTPSLPSGDIVFGMTGWQEWVLATERNRFAVLPTGLGLDLATVMNVLGVTGITAYFGLLDVGQLMSRATWSSSRAPPAPRVRWPDRSPRPEGAKKVVGIAGGAGKCAEVVERYGFDECLDYREAHLRRRLRAACPDGVDLYFDNVGGEILDDVLANSRDARSRRALWRDLAVQRRRGRHGHREHVDADRSSRAHGGFHHPRLRVALRRGSRRTRVDGRSRAPSRTKNTW
jgi:NADPH-dependent curcumin reductase CurA